MKNVFEVLGLKADHRAAATKVVQLPRHMDEITVAKSKEGPFHVDTKYDGNHAVIPVKCGEVLGVFSRVGKPFTNMDIFIHKILDEGKMKDGVYFAELYCEREKMPMQKFQALHGTNRKAALNEAQVTFMQEEARLAFFDHITLEAFIGDKEGVAKDDRPLLERRSKLEKNLKKFSKSARCHAAKYVECADEAEVREVAKKRIKDGEEGIVAKGVNHPYVCGHKNFHFIKIVKKVFLDLTCVGFYEGEGKRAGTLGGLLFQYGEHEIRADLGKGYDDAARAAMFKVLSKGKKKDDSPIGKIYEIYALEKLGNTNLRQAKVGKVREDKLTQDIKKENTVAKKTPKADKQKAPKVELTKEELKAQAKAAKKAEKAGKGKESHVEDKKADKPVKEEKAKGKKDKADEPPFTPDEPKGKSKGKGKDKSACPETGIKPPKEPKAEKPAKEGKKDKKKKK